MVVAILLVSLFALLALFLYNQSNQLLLNERILFFPRLPQAFDGLRILHVSDLHDKRFGEHQERLLYLTKQSQPDLIVISGDLLYRRKDGANTAAMDYIRGAVDIAPVYFSPGNHEALAPRDYAALKQFLLDAGVTVLENRGISLVKNGEHIHLFGIQDPYFFHPEDSDNPAWIAALDTLFPAPIDNFSLLISHRPEKFSLYVQTEVDLVFSGHAHGGQIRLPLVHGLYAPQQGLFPKYTSGAHQSGRTVMHVSRGLGKSLFPFRVFNRPELILLQLRSE